MFLVLAWNIRRGNNILDICKAKEQNNREITETCVDSGLWKKLLESWKNFVYWNTSIYCPILIAELIARELLTTLKRQPVHAGNEKETLWESRHTFMHCTYSSGVLYNYMFLLFRYPVPFFLAVELVDIPPWYRRSLVLFCFSTRNAYRPCSSSKFETKKKKKKNPATQSKYFHAETN